MLVRLYLAILYVISIFFPFFAHDGSSSRLQYVAHSHISILSLSQHHHFTIHFVDNEFEKIN
jgi:hypothetical protein